MKALPVTPDQPEVGTWVLLWENGTWLKGYRLYDGWRIIYADGQRDYPPEKVQVTHWALLPPEPGDESPSSDPDEVQKLRQWKKEATALLNPIMAYGQSHPDCKLGSNVSEFVLNRAKAAEVLVVALKEIASPISRLTKKEIKYLADEGLKEYEQLKQQ